MGGFPGRGRSAARRRTGLRHKRDAGRLLGRGLWLTFSEIERLGRLRLDRITAFGQGVGLDQSVKSIGIHFSRANVATHVTSYSTATPSGDLLTLDPPQFTSGEVVNQVELIYGPMWEIWEFRQSVSGLVDGQSLVST